MNMREQNLDQQLDAREDKGGVTGALISDIVLQLLSYVAQVKRESIHRRPGGGHSRRLGARREVRKAQEESARPLQKHLGKLPCGAYHQVDDGMAHQSVCFRHREGCRTGTGRRTQPRVKRKGAKAQVEAGADAVNKYTFLDSYFGPHYTHPHAAACKETAALHTRPTLDF